MFGNNLFAVVGPFGSGKSLYAVERAIGFCNKFKKSLITNFPIDHSVAREYALARGYRWFSANCRIIEIHIAPDKPEDLMKLWAYKNSVVVFDEAGVNVNSRFWSLMPKAFLQKLFQLRHLNIHMFLVFQFEKQIDTQFRSVIQYWLRCNSLSAYSPSLGLPKIYARFVYAYKVEKYNVLSQDSKKSAHLIWPWFMAEFVYWRFPGIESLFWPFYNFLQDLLFLAIYLTLNREFQRHYRYSWESYLFRIFSSKRLVGEEARTPAPFLTQADFDDHYSLSPVPSALRNKKPA